MTINSLSAIASTPVAGLGTQTFNVTTAGLYTLSYKSFLPYFPAGTPAQSAGAVAEVTDITFAADSSGSKNSTWFKFYAASDLVGYYVWFNINSAGVDPAPAGLVGIEVAGATDATAATLATAAITAINTVAGSYVTATAGASGHVIITNDQVGSATNAANGTASYGASFSVTTAGTFGTPEQSGLAVVISQNSTVLARYVNTSATTPIMGGSVLIQASASDVLTIAFSSLSTADAALNAVKSIVNLYQGE